MNWPSDDTTFIKIDDARLECRSWGAPPDVAPTVVMLHEGLGSVAQWRAFPEQLAERSGCGVFAYSRSGYGRSSAAPLPRPLDYMTREAVDVLPKVLDAIGFQRGVLLGHSDGASIAAIYLGTIEDFRVRGLCLMAPHFFVEDVGLEAIADARTAFEQGDLRDRLGKYHDDPENAFRGWNEAWLDPEFKDWNIEDAIAYIRVPTLVIQGDNDLYGTIAQVEALEAQAYSPVDRAILSECGHAPHREQPEMILDLVCEFLARLKAFEAQTPVGR